MRKSERKLFLFGRYSIALLLPKRWLGELEVKAGSFVNLEFDRARKRIVIRFSSTRAPEKPRRPNTKPAEQSDELEPIPQL